jgi:hypothetical protein
MDQLLQKLMKSKAIMDASDDIKRGDVRNISNTNMVANFDAPNAKYNIPSEFLQSESYAKPTTPQIKNNGQTSIESIKNSKLPEEIKRLMIEHPIAQPSQPQVGISNELIEKASRLMKKEDNNYVPESAKPKNTSSSSNNIDYNVLKKLVNESVREALKENGLIAESTEKSNETFTFRVGKHIFEGKISKIKKLS